MKKAIMIAALLATACRAGAIELSLEENRAERGNIGFVDMQRIFKLFPETLKAKEAFEEAVRQAEEQLNLRKTDTLKLRAELEALKTEREAAAKAPPPPTQPLTPLYPPEKTPPAAAPAAAPTPTPPAAPNPPAADASLKNLPGFVAATTTGAAPSGQPLTINLPGATTGPVVVSPPSGAATAAAPTPPPAPVPVTAPAPPPQTPVPAPVAAAAPSRLQELDGLIAQKTQELERKETESREQQATTEKNLLDLESRRSEVLLGKIYHAVQEVSRREGISVVVDKSGILYGQSAVDLTEKVLKQLKGS